MVWFHGKCAACGVGAKHKNFNGRRNGRPLPQPCHVTLRRGRSPKDTRICERCYKVHLANTPSEPETPVSTPQVRNRQSTSSLDGVAWSDTASERVAKVVQRTPDGEAMIPLSLHEQKMQEQALALRRESVAMLEARQCESRHLKDQYVVEGFFRRKEISAHDKALVFERVLQFYKEEPSAERAQLLRDLKNGQVANILGISSHTMAKARCGDFGVKGPVKRPRKTRHGMEMEEVRRIVREACFDERYCEIRSWASHVGGRVIPHFECVGLVDAQTMWESLCRKHGEFCSLRTFYRCLPDIYVPKKKERCVCAHCKKGKRVLDNTGVIIRALKQAARGRNDLLDDLHILRWDVIRLYGHLDKEIVIDIADGRHQPRRAGCAACGLVEDIPWRLGVLLARVDSGLSFSRLDWATLFPGVQLPRSGRKQAAAVLEFVEAWQGHVEKLVQHLLLKADRIRALEAHVKALDVDLNAKVWIVDFSMPVKLVGVVQETEADFLDNSTANILGFMRMYGDGRHLWREYWDFVFEGSKDLQASVQIQKCMYDFVCESRAEMGLPKLQRLQVWADNASDFKGGDMWDQWRKEVGCQNPGEGLHCVELNYHAAGEGKTQLDAHFGHLKTVRIKRERRKVERRTVADLLNAMADVEATHVVHVELQREQESRFYRTADGADTVHRVVVKRGQLQAQEDSQTPLAPLLLDQVKPRKTKRAREVQASIQARITHVAHEDECQKCFNKVTDAEAAIQCDGCERSWHKTCIGIAAQTPVEEVEWGQLCGNCGGVDPQGESLEKRRKPALCEFCGQRRRRIDHSMCKQRKEDEVEKHRTPRAVVLSTTSNATTWRKPLTLSQEKRKLRKPRRKRKRSGVAVSASQLDELKSWGQESEM